MNWLYKKPQTINEVTDYTGGDRPAQPSQRFKWNPQFSPRMDNANQPWYGANDRWWGQGPDVIQDYDPITQDSSGQSNYNLSSFWSSLNGFFGGQDAKSNLIGVSPLPQSSTKPFRWSDGGAAARAAAKELDQQ